MDGGSGTGGNGGCGQDRTEGVSLGGQGCGTFTGRVSKEFRGSLIFSKGGEDIYGKGVSLPLLWMSHGY